LPVVHTVNPAASQATPKPGKASTAAAPSRFNEGGNMFQLKHKVIALALGLAFSLGATAQDMSKESYKAEKDGIEAAYKSAKAACDGMSGNQKDICVAEAKGNEKISKAELEAKYKPSEKNVYDAKVAKANADFDVAEERCDDQSGDAKDVCVKDAKAKETAAKADAKSQMKTRGAT
jgi:hypothetical protein